MQQRHQIAPDEVLCPAKETEDYLAWRACTDLRAPYRISPEFLMGTKPDAEFDTDEAPLIVFINARSGGRVGPELASVLARAVGSSQVFDLSEYRPDRVLRQIWDNLQQQEQLGNARAGLVRSRLRILACGGDGTIAWILKVIQQLDLQPHPAVAIMPLGTGNDLSRSFRWGAEFEHGWIKGHASVYSTLKRVADARVSDLDCWRLRLLLPNSSYKPAKTYAMTEVPQSEQQQQPVSPGCAGEAHDVLMEGLFWNYFSVGADAQAAYNFHHLRDSHPSLASNRVANQFWYSTFSCTSGWFCGAIPSVSSFTQVQVLQPGSSSWTSLHIPPTIKALVLVNLQSYAGGRNIWGGKAPKQEGRWSQPSFSDGLIEVVGFHSGYHAMAVMATGAKLANGKRLAQVAGIRLALHGSVARPDGEAEEVFMQLDGEPWMQKVPDGRSASQITLEVVHAGVSKLLCNAEQPDPSPESKMTALLGKQQAAAYLTATADQAPTVDSVQEVHLRQLGGICLQQQHLEAHLAAGSEPAVGSGLCDSRLELPSAAHDGAAAHVLLQPPCRVAYTDGGAPYGSAPQPSSMAVAAAAASGLMRHSLDVVVGGSSSGMYGAAGTSSSSSGYSGGSPASSNSTEVPSAVAVIETRSSGMLSSSGDGSKKVVLIEQQGGGGVGGKGVGSIILSPSSGKTAGSGKAVPPAFVQLAQQRNVAGEY